MRNCFILTKQIHHWSNSYFSSMETVENRCIGIAEEEDIFLDKLWNEYKS